MSSGNSKDLKRRHNDSERSSSEDEKSPELKFKNDGSFLETFKKMQDQMANNKSATKEETKEKPAENAKTEDKPKKPSLLSCVGKRRGGKVLPTGMVKKAKKPEEEESSSSKDPWSQYLNEVRKYKEMSCQDEDKNRPLVK